ncbi:hypothetical protein CCP3SC15_4270003 [Gammaproteobacteria bacterium]
MKSSKKTKRSTKKFGKRRFAKKKPISFKKKVAKAVGSLAEVKYVSTGFAPTYHNSAISFGDALIMVPPMNQGLSNRQRVGAKVNFKNLKVKICISQAPFSLLTDLDRPVLVRCMLLKYKRGAYAADFPGTGFGGDVDYRLLQEDSSSPAQPYDGSILKHLYDVNRDLFTVVKDWSFPLLPNEHNDTHTNTETTALGKNFKILTANVSGPTQLIYGADSNSLPNNFAPFLLIGYSYPDGDLADILNRGLIATVQATMSYTDE